MALYRFLTLGCVAQLVMRLTAFVFLDVTFSHANTFIVSVYLCKVKRVSMTCIIPKAKVIIMLS